MRRTRPNSMLNVEQDVATWAPITPPVAPSSQPLSFVDGVRRMEARLVVTRNGRTVHGALGAYGVGVVECREGRATFAEERRGRVAIFGAGEMPPRLSSLAPCAQLPAPQRCRGRCRRAAARPARRDARRGGAVGPRRMPPPERIVLADGPLNVGESDARRVVGFVKRLFKLYLPPEQLPVLRLLPLGARTPVFLISSAGRFSRYSWFLRIGPRLAIESDFTGLVRLEVSAVRRARRGASAGRPHERRCCRASCRRARATRARRRTWCRSARSSSTCVAASATRA